MSRIKIWGVDDRFDTIRASTPAFAAFWALQAVWVLVIALSFILLGASKDVVPLSTMDAVVAAMFVVGLGIEMVADGQKGAQRKWKAWPDEGLWRYSRHPNYFGEMLLWWGVYLAAIPALHGSWRYLAVLSPIVETVVLLFVTGVPVLEKSADQRNKGNDQYWTYKRRTSVVLPIPPAFYDRLAAAIKRRVLLDLSMFNQYGYDSLRSLLTSYARSSEFGASRPTL